jgi:predicted DNA binding CopG/RHH family protein
MSPKKLDQEEKDILEAFESGEYESVLTDERKKFLAGTVEHTFKKDKRINIRLSSRDLDALQRRALREGVPYQTLVSSVLHKYVSGGLRETSADYLPKKDTHKTRAS